MKKNEIKVGGLYAAKVSGRNVAVRVDAVRAASKEGTFYDVTNLTTGRKITFRSAAKFQREVKPKQQDDLLGQTLMPGVESPAVETVTPCEACDGTGVDEDNVTCDYCKGTGNIGEGEQSPDPTRGTVGNPSTTKESKGKSSGLNESSTCSDLRSASKGTATAAAKRASKNATAVNSAYAQNVVKVEGEQGSDFPSRPLPAVTPQRIATAAPSGSPALTVVAAAPPAAGFASDTPLTSLLKKSVEQTSAGQPPHLIVQALAGTGKTTTLIEGLKRLKGIPTKIEPSPQQAAIWEQMELSRDARTICFVAFNKAIATELQNRVPNGCAAMTMHSMGFKACQQAHGRLEPSQWVVPDLIADICNRDLRQLRKDKATVLKAVEALVGLCKVNLVGPPWDKPESEGPNYDGWSQALTTLAAHYDVDINGSSREIFELVPAVLERCRNPKGRIDFNDMIYLPVALNLPVFRYDLLLVDECLPGHTPVMLADGSSKRIDEIVESEEEFSVRSFDVGTGKATNCLVTGKRKISNTKPSVRISVRHQGKSGGVSYSKRSFVICTVDHKIWTTNRGWIPAGQITVSDTLILETDAEVVQHGKQSKHSRKLASERQLANCTLRGHIGGNGRGLTLAEKSLLGVLQRHDENWKPGHVVPTGQKVKNGMPSRFMLDLAHPIEKICVEVDGSSHSNRRDQDRRKEEFLMKLGWTVLRVSNSVAINNPESVLCKLTGNCPRPAKVVSVKAIDIPDKYVYDIAVARCHNFYANGILVHNCQDLNRCQQALAKKAGKRLILVGDSKQAIYGFAGADSESMDRMKRELGIDDSDPQQALAEVEGSKPGCVVLPLTVTRRCGKAIVDEARKLVPEFEAHESNGSGKVSIAKYDDKSPAGVYPRPEAIAGDGHYVSRVQDGDMILCRVNAPLVSQCFRFLRAGRRANIQGRDIGQGLISTVTKLKAASVVDLIGKLSDWLHAETAKENAKRNPSEGRLIALQDRHDCLCCFADGAETVDGVVKKITDIFTDDRNGTGIKLSSIHKAKGLESKRVFFLTPKGGECPHPMAKSAWQRGQEMNLRYVAITRAIEELIFVS